MEFPSKVQIQKLPKIVEKHFFWWKEQTILPKNVFLAQFEIVLNFQYFFKLRACRISSKIQISKKLPKIVETLLWWGKQTIYPKNIFFTQFEIVLNFHYFCKVRACRISVKNPNFQKLPKIVEKHFFWWGEQIILPKNIFLAQFEIVLNIHYFCKPVEFPSKIQFSKNCLKLWRNTSLMRGTNNLSKKYFLHTIWDSTKFSLFL